MLNNVNTDNGDHSAGLDITVSQAGNAKGGGPWQVSFDVENRNREAVELVDAWLPHTRFNAEVQALGGMELGPGESMRLTFTAAFDEPPGTAAENAFVILRLRWQGETWRNLTRMTVASGARGEPSATVETVTSHRVGFSEG
jgi:hypothetical protein